MAKVGGEDDSPADQVDVVGVDGRKRLGSGLAGQPEVISEREQVAGFFSFGH